MELSFLLSTLTRRGVIRPGPPFRIAAQLRELRRWGYGLAGELRQAAARDPERIVLIDEQAGRISYRELSRRAESLARALCASYGIQPGDRVGILCRNHHGLVETAVAAALLGADPVLINTGLSAPQLATVAQEQRLRLLRHDDEFAERLDGIPADVQRINDRRHAELTDDQPHPGLTDDRRHAEAPVDALTPPPRSGRTVVLTSGTTGAPKGAQRPNPAGFGPLISIIGRIPLNVGERILIAAPLFHTWGYAALQLAFSLRATIVLQRRFDPAATLSGLAEHRCGALFAVPVMVQRLLETTPAPDRPLSLRMVAVSGSALPGGLATRFMDAYGEVLYNLYGSTEVSWAAIATPADLRRAPATAGHPPHGTRLAILDGYGSPASTGQTGRIFVGNEMLFEGYTSGTSRERRGDLMATGDLGHVDADGLLFVEGREDDMIISGGENVFPSEVEGLLADLPQVREAAVIGVPDDEFGQRLAAYLVLREGERLDAETVREHVRRHRARHCIPRDVVFLDALPRNATGKVLTRELPRPPS